MSVFTGLFNADSREGQVEKGNGGAVDLTLSGTTTGGTTAALDFDVNSRWSFLFNTSIILIPSPTIKSSKSFGLKHLTVHALLLSPTTMENFDLGSPVSVR